MQSLRSPALDAVFGALSFMGEEPFYLVVILVLYWMIDKRLATRFAALFLVSAWSNSLLKIVAHQPRPSGSLVAILDNPAGGGLPSGHAQNSLATWGFLAVRLKRKRRRRLIALLLLGIGLSRIYRGVHFPQDVLAGWMIGGALLALFLIWEPHLEPWLKRQPVAVPMALGTIATLVLLLLHHEESARNAMATLCGLCLGVPLERSTVRFSPRHTQAWRSGARFLLGLAGALLIWRGLKPLLPADDAASFAGDAASFVRYALLGLWVTLGAPWLFVRARLAQREVALSG